MKKLNTANWVIKYITTSLMVLSVSGACKKSSRSSQSGDPVLVDVAVVRQQKVSFYNDYPATVVALNQVELRSEVSGLITGIFFNEGTFVHKGQKLYEIDRSNYIASFEQAKALVEIANANVDKAQRYVDRYNKLNEQDAIAKQQVDDALTNLQDAKLQLVSAKAGLVKAQTNLDYSLIIAPFDGTIGLSQVKMGTLITPGQTLLNTISSDDPMGVDIVINENELGRFQELLTDKVQPGDSTIRISLPDNSLYPDNGKIQVIDRAVDPQTGTIRVRMVFPNKRKELRAGMSCEVHILNSVASKQLVIPFKSVMEQMSEYFVFVVDSQKVKQTKVTLGAQFEGKVVVTSGLAQGQQIVTDGVQKLHNGTSVIVGQERPADEKK